VLWAAWGWAGLIANAAPEQAVVLVGAATNFAHVLVRLDAEFQRQHPDHLVRPTSAASGTLFAQIQHGAPYDVFLSADTDYPEQLVAKGLGVGSTLRIFSRGRLVAWTTRPGVDPADTLGWASSTIIKKIAIAQPKTAPYGRAALRFLEKSGIWQLVQGKVVLGENIGQTAQFVETGHAELGLVALSLVLTAQPSLQGRWVEVAPSQFEGVSLDHAVVLTRAGWRNPAARRYVEFLTGQAAQSILSQAGYHPISQ